jgi:hypothetical protein
VGTCHRFLRRVSHSLAIVACGESSAPQPPHSPTFPSSDRHALPKSVNGLLELPQRTTSRSNPAFLTTLSAGIDYWRTKGEHCKIRPYGPTPRQARSGDVEQGEPCGAATDSRASQLARGAGLLRAKLPGLPTHLQSHSEPAPDADACSGLEAVVEVALTSSRHKWVWPSSSDLPRSAAGLAERSGLQNSKRIVKEALIWEEGNV